MRDEAGRGPRVVLVVPAFPKASETFVAARFAALLERGWDVHVVCWQTDEESWRAFPRLADDAAARRRVHQVRLHRSRLLFAAHALFAFLRCTLEHPIRTAGFLRAAAKAAGWRALLYLPVDAQLIRLNPDVVHFEFGALAAGRAYLRKALESRLLVSFRGYDLNYAGIESPGYYGDVWAQADGLHLLGDALWRAAQARGCPPDKRHWCVAPAVDLRRFCRDASSERMPGHGSHAELRIVSVGRLEWVKGYEYALSAVRRLIDRGIACHYRIVGDGAMLEALSFACHQLGITKHVTFAGRQSPDVIRDHLLWADVFLHAAVSEGFCNSVLEAQAMELPVVCSDAGGLPENVLDGETGFVVPRRDPEALATKLERLAADEDLRGRMGRAGRRRVLDHFDLDTHVATFEAVYRELAGA